MGLVFRGVWSDEVEAICRVGEMLIRALIPKANIRWEQLLPGRFRASATLPPEINTTEHAQIRRSLSAQLDALAKTINDQRSK